MKIYHFGAEDAPALLLLPGTCCHWKGNFGAVIPLLADSFRVLCVSYDGFDETEQTEFPTMLEETERSRPTSRPTAAVTSGRPTAVLWGALLWACWRRGRTSTWIMVFWAALIWIRHRRWRQDCRLIFCCH